MDALTSLLVNGVLLLTMLILSVGILTAVTLLLVVAMNGRALCRIYGMACSLLSDARRLLEEVRVALSEEVTTG